MSSAAEARVKERSRVKSGVMNGLARLILYRDKPQDDEADPDADPSHWSQVAFKTLEYVPPGIEAGIRLTKVLRRSRVMLKEKGRSPMKAFVFARVEEGKSYRIVSLRFPLNFFSCEIDTLMLPLKFSIILNGNIAVYLRNHHQRSGGCVHQPDRLQLRRVTDRQSQQLQQPQQGLLRARQEVPRGVVQGILLP